MVQPVIVKSDPRFKIDIETLKQNQKFAEMVRKLSDTLTKATTRISETKKQGISDRSDDISSRIRMLGFRGASSIRSVSQAAKVGFEKMEKKVSHFIDLYNKVYEKNVAAYQKLVKESGFSLFSKFKPLKVK